MSPTSSTTSNPLTNQTSSNSSNSGNTATSGSDPLANESTFLTLLVSQLQNQDPLNPVDSTQFVSQLTEYSQLEQLIGIKANTTNLLTDVTPGTTPTSTDSGTGSQSTTSNQQTTGANL
jgi:flagellar basal-body rod modification protein FlgD